MQDTSKLPIVTIVVLIVIALVVAYAASYSLLIDDTTSSFSVVRAADGQMLVRRDVDYRYDSKSVTWFYWPAHAVDRWLRPDVWELGPGGIDTD